MKIFLKKYFTDIMIVFVILVLGLSSFFVMKSCEKTVDTTAYIYVSSVLKEKVNLSKESFNYRYIQIDGKYGKVKIAIKQNDIKIVESTCPNKDCILQGSATTLKPLICAYNEVMIELKGEKELDVELG